VYGLGFGLELELELEKKIPVHRTQLPFPLSKLILVISISHFEGPDMIS